MARKGTPLNAQSVKAATAEPGIRITLNDPSTPGLHLRVSGHTGEKTWTHRFYLGGKERKRRIGTYPAMSLADARAEVERRRVMIRAGEDPDREHKERAAGDLSFGALAEMVLGAKAKTTRARTQELRRDAVDRYLVPAWGDRPANGITRADVIELCEAIRDRGHGITANRVRSTAHVIFAEGVVSRVRGSTLPDRQPGFRHEAPFEGRAYAGPVPDPRGDRAALGDPRGSRAAHRGDRQVDAPDRAADRTDPADALGRDRRRHMDDTRRAP